MINRSKKFFLFLQNAYYKISMTDISEFTSFVRNSRMEESISELERLWEEDVDYTEILDAVVPAALSSFSHRFSSMHVPKENEYLRRILNQFPRNEQIDFLKRYIEYLVWSPKYIANSKNALVSGTDYYKTLENSFLESLEKKEGIPALHYIHNYAEQSLSEAVKTILRIGCIDVSQAIGHYFSCTESMIRLALAADMPDAGDHLFAATLYIMQSSPVKITNPKEPETGLEEIISKTIRKSGFSGYHYLILINGLINQKEFLGDEYYLHALNGLENVLPSLSDGMSHKYFNDLVAKAESKETGEDALKHRIWKGDKAGAFACLSSYYNENGLTKELKNAILYSYTKIDDHPHDPHYVTVPTSLFELIDVLSPEDIILALAHTVEFGCDRIKRRGVMSDPVNSS